MKRSEPCSEHPEVLLALITYMGLTGWRSPAAHGLSRDLGLDEAKVAAALTRLPGLFVKDLSTKQRPGRNTRTRRMRGTRYVDRASTALRSRPRAGSMVDCRRPAIPLWGGSDVRPCWRLSAVCQRVNRTGGRHDWHDSR